MVPGERAGLGTRFFGDDLGSRLRIVETQNPFARDILAVHFRWRKFPAARGTQGLFGKIFARPGGIEVRSYNIPRRIHADSHADAHRAANGVPRFLGHVRQDLIEDFAGNKAWRGSLGLQGSRRGGAADRVLLFLAARIFLSASAPTSAESSMQHVSPQVMARLRWKRFAEIPRAG